MNDFLPATDYLKLMDLLEELQRTKVAAESKEIQSHIEIIKSFCRKCFYKKDK